MTESQKSDRREFVRRLVSLGGLAGLAGLSFGKLAEKTRLLTPVYAQTSGSPLIIGVTNAGGTDTTQLVSNTGATNTPPAAPEAGTLRLENDLSVSDITSPTPIALVAYASAAAGFSNPPAINGGVGVWGQSDSVAGVGLYGRATATSGSNFGVIGWSDSIGGVGVRGVANASTGSTIGVDGRSESVNGTGVRGLAGVAGTKPIIAQGASGQTANLQEWQNNLGTALSVVDPNGNLGVGTSAPTSPLHVLGVGNVCRIQSTTGQAHLVLDGGGPFFDLFQLGVMKYQWGMDASAGPNTFFVYDVTNAKYRMQFDQQHGNVLFQNGNVGIGVGLPGFRLDVAGQVHATGFPTSSDMRFKTDIQPIDNALNKVLRLNGVYFKWNQLHRETLKRSSTLTSRQVGLIAQQVRDVLPEVVSEWADEGAEDYLAVDYSRLVAITIEAVKEQETQIREQQTEIEAMKEQHERFKNENEKLNERIVSLERTVKRFTAS